MFQPHKAKKNLIVCSVEDEYQDVDIDVNDTLCQSYSLLNYFAIPFDKTPSATASIGVKRSRQLAMVNMYMKIIKNKEFLKKFDEIVKNKKNKHLWEDTIDNNNTFYIIEKFKKSEPIIRIITNILYVWEAYGWQFFIGNGKCLR